MTVFSNASALVAFAKQGEPPRSPQKGDRVEIAHYDWTAGDVLLTGEVTRVDGDQVSLRVDDGLLLRVRACQCSIVSGEAS